MYYQIVTHNLSMLQLFNTLIVTALHLLKVLALVSPSLNDAYH